MRMIGMRMPKITRSAWVPSPLEEEYPRFMGVREATRRCASTCWIERHHLQTSPFAVW
jgi:hypothetical protein